MTSKILELSQSEADLVNTNGDYHISLPQNSDLILKEGDQLLLKNVFIDTESQSDQKIVIDKTITCELQFIKYYMYSRDDECQDFASNPAAPLVEDGQPYILCKNLGGSATTLKEVLSFEITNSTDEGENVMFQFRYTNSKGEASVWNSEVFGAEANSGQQYGPVSIVYDSSQPHSFITVQPLGFPLTISISEQRDISATGPDFEPVPFNKKITIQKGNYSPEQIVVEMNRELQKGGVSGETNDYLDVSPFLGKYGSSNFYLVRQDGEKIVEITGNLLLGATQVELAYESDTNQFSWNYLHTPYFIPPAAPTPAQPAVGYVRIGATNNYFTINKNSGISLTNFISQYPDKTPAFFFSKTLAFSNTMFVKWDIREMTSPYNGTANIKRPILSTLLQDNINTTGGYLPISAQLDRTSATWYKPITIPGGLPFLSTTTDTFNILGTQDTISNTQFSYGYFLVEVNGNFNSNYYSKVKSPNVMGIVSRYYELNSFTSGTSDDSLIYTHRGLPVPLSSFGVRILKPNKDVADNLGENSTVFIQIISAQSQ